MAEHRVPLLHRRFEDPATSRDPRVRELVSALATLEPAPPPRAEFRAELRAQLVAVTPRIVAEEAPTPAKAAATSAAKPAVAHRAFSLKRPLLLAATMITVAALILGGAVWMSQKAIPGDTLYGLKRTSERVELALDGSDKARADDYLRFAGRRVDEARQLLARTSAYGGGTQAAAVSPETARQIVSTLSSGDSDVLSANTLLNRETLRAASGNALDTLIAWAPGQLDKLVHLRDASPTDALRARTLTSWTLVRDSLVQAKALQVARGTHSTGPLPNPGNSTSATHGTSHTPNGTSTSKHPGGTSGATTPSSGSPRPGTTSTAPGGIVPTLPVHLPTPSLPLPTSILPGSLLPTKLPLTVPTTLPTKVPVSVSPTCVSASVVIGVSVGCGGH